MHTSNEIELKSLINKRNRLIGDRAFMRRNCDIIVLQSNRLDYEQYNDIINALTQRIRWTSVEIKTLKAKMYPEKDLRTNRVLSGLEHIMEGL